LIPKSNSGTRPLGIPTIFDILHLLSLNPVAEVMAVPMDLEKVEAKSTL